MRSSFSYTRRVFLPAILAAAGLGTVTAWSQSQGQPIRLSVPSSPVITSNLSDAFNPGLERLNPSESGFKQVQDDLFRPLANSLKSVNSMQGILELPLQQPGRPQFSRHARELIDQRKNWAFADFKDLYPEANAEEMLGVKESNGDGQDKQGISLIQKYYERLSEKPSKDKDKSGQEPDLTGTRQYSISNGLQFLSRTFPASDQFTRILFSGGPEAYMSEKASADSEDSPSVLGDADQLRAERKRFADFQRMLNPNQQLSGLPNDSNATSPEEIARRAAEPYRSSIAPMLGMIDPTQTALHTHVDDDPTAIRLGMPNPLKSTAPAKRSETFQQMLDPFAAGMAKPKY